MRIDSVRMCVFIAFFLIICQMNESLAGRRDGTIASFATVDPDADMDDRSTVGQFSVVHAKVHLHYHSHILSHVIVERGSILQTRAIVKNHAKIGSEVEIGNGTICEESTIVGQLAVLGDKAVMEYRSIVMSHAKIGPNCVVGAFSTVGRHAELGESVFVAQHAKIGSGALLGPRSIVQPFVHVPVGLKTKPKQVVINAPESTSLIRMVTNRQYSKRFYKAVDEMVAKSDTKFARHFSRELGFILSDLNDCKKFQEAFPQMVYLIYSYLHRMHGEKKLGEYMNNKNSARDDCDNARRYDRIFDKKTVDKFIVLMACIADYSRRVGIDREDFCSIIKDLLASRRSVLTINENCDGTRRSLCSGCGDGDKTSGSYLITSKDIDSYE